MGCCVAVLNEQDLVVASASPSRSVLFLAPKIKKLEMPVNAG
jgi:hypothetical protein